MKKVQIIPLALVFAMLTGCAGIKTDKFYVRACQECLENYRFLTSFEEITNLENPDVILPPLPENYGKISDEFIEVEEYHKVIFHTTQDTVLGTLNFYV